MLDHVSFNVTGRDAEQLLLNPSIDWNITIDPSTEEIKKWEAKFHNMRLIATKTTFMRISGSLHKLRNALRGKGQVNHDQLEFEGVREAVAELKKFLGLPGNRIAVHSLEFGLNIDNPPFHISAAIDQILCLDSKPFSTYEACGKFARITQATLKAYHKGIQSGTGQETLRAEFRAYKMDFLHRKGVMVRTLDDLTKWEIYPQMLSVLVKMIGRAVIHEMQPLRVTAKRTDRAERERQTADKLEWDRLGNPNNWSRISTEQRTAQRNKHRRIKAAYFPEPLSKKMTTCIVYVFNSLTVSYTESPGKNDHLKKVATPPGIGGGKPNRARKNDPLDERSYFQGGSGPIGEGQSATNAQQVEADSEARPLPTCKVCGNAIEGRGKGAATCSQVCKGKADAIAKRAKRRAGKFGNEPGRLFTDSA